MTLFTYLNDVKSGGETHFTKLNLKIKPKKGLGVLHFPCYVPSASAGGLFSSDMRGERDRRTEHESCDAADEKYICTQWGWSGPLLRAAIEAHLRPKTIPLSETVL